MHEAARRGLQAAMPQQLLEGRIRDSSLGPLAGSEALQVMDLQPVHSGQLRRLREPLLEVGQVSVRSRVDEDEAPTAGSRVSSSEPPGRNFYLHQSSKDEPWRSALTGPSARDSRLNQKVAVTPVRQGASIQFDVDFDNLTRREMELQAFALRPSPAFRIRIGMGKPISLGTVRIDPLSLELVDAWLRAEIPC